VAVNCCVPPGISDADCGEIVTEVKVTGMVTVAVAFDTPAWAAVTVKLPPMEPAVNRPEVEIVPPVAVQVIPETPCTNDPSE
jgi:hypothetical protein